MCAQAALLHAYQLAEHFQAELHLMHVIEGVRDEATASFRLDSCPASISIKPVHNGNSPKSASLPGVSLHRVMEQGQEAAQAILAYAREHHAGMIVMGAHGDAGANRFLASGMNYLLTGSTTEQVVQKASCPVFAVGLRCGRFPGLVRRILAPVDFSGYSALSVWYGKQLARLYNARLELLHVIEAPPAFSANGCLDVSQDYGTLVTCVKQKLQQLLDETEGPDVPADLHVAQGRPSDEIPAYAERNDIQLIVLGSHGQHGKEQLPLGSESEQIARMASFPLFMVRDASVRTVENRPEVGEILSMPYLTASQAEAC